MNERVLVRIRVEGDDICQTYGWLTPTEQDELVQRCKAADVTCGIEPLDLPMGLDAVLDEPDVDRAQDIRSIIERREKSNG